MIGVERHRQAALVDPRQLLHDHDRAQEVRARAAVLLLQPGHRNPSLPAFRRALAIDLTLLAPARLVRDDLPIGKRSERFAKRLVLSRRTGCDPFAGMYHRHISLVERHRKPVMWPPWVGEEKKRPGTTPSGSPARSSPSSPRVSAGTTRTTTPTVEARPITPMSRSVTLHDLLTTQLLPRSRAASRPPSSTSIARRSRPKSTTRVAVPPIRTRCAARPESPHGRTDSPSSSISDTRIHPDPQPGRGVGRSIVRVLQSRTPGPPPDSATWERCRSGFESRYNARRVDCRSRPARPSPPS